MLKRRILKCVLSLIALTGCSVAEATLVNDVPSCYEANHIARKPNPDKVVFVLIDQTVKLDDQLKNQALRNIDRMIEPGARFVIAEFSAFSEGRYLQVLKTGIVETPLKESDYDDIPITRAPTIKSCFKGQFAFARKLAFDTAKKAMNDADPGLARSDIFAALQNIGKAIEEAPEKSKVLFLISDALENSSVTSFYVNNTVREIDANAELEKVKHANLLANLEEAKVYVLGAGVMGTANRGSRDARNGYRDPQTMTHLKAFWRSYFDASHAKLIEFGAPSLVNPVRY